jgi:hypothetical protein
MNINSPKRTLSILTAAVLIATGVLTTGADAGPTSAGAAGVGSWTYPNGDLANTASP